MKNKLFTVLLLLFSINCFCCTCPKFKDTETGWAGFKHAKNYMSFLLLVEKLETKTDKVIFKVIKDFKNNYKNEKIIILNGNSELNCTFSNKIFNNGQKFLFNIYSNNENNKNLEFKLSECFESYIDITNQHIKAVINSNDSMNVKNWTVKSLENELNIKLNNSNKTWYYSILVLFLIVGVIYKYKSM